MVDLLDLLVAFRVDFFADLKREAASGRRDFFVDLLDFFDLLEDLERADALAMI